jgi:hypothetical protein
MAKDLDKEGQIKRVQGRDSSGRVLNSQHSKKKKKDTVVLVHLESWHSEG